MKLLALILTFLSLSLNAQKLMIDTVHKPNLILNFKSYTKQSNVLSFNYQNLVAITMQPNLNKNVFKAPNIEQGISTAFQYDVKTKVHVTKNISFIVRTQLSAISNIASLGLSFKLK